MWFIVITLIVNAFITGAGLLVSSNKWEDPKAAMGYKACSLAFCLMNVISCVLLITR